MRRSGALQIIFAFFLGLVLVAFVWISVLTFYPYPSDGTETVWQSWQLTTGIILLITATVILVVSLALPSRLDAIANGILLGGVFTMLSAVITVLPSENGIGRLVVVTVALAVTIVIGHLRFGRKAAPAVPAQGDPVLLDRVEALERRFEALRRAVQD
jgi:hypothetical protein